MFRFMKILLLSLVLITLLGSSVTAGPCPVGDLDGNCRVDWQDVLRFARQWLDPADCSGAGCADLIGDDGVDMADFALLAESWGQCWTGSLQVTINPLAARGAGALWRVDGGLWRDSGYTEQDLPMGQHVIEFKTGTLGWVRPASQQVQVNIGQTTNADGTYTAVVTANVLINEFVASNRDGLMDGDDRFSDWIEICNSDSQQVDISGWYLTDNKNDLTKWEFPDAVAPLPAGWGYLLIFASGKNDANYPYADPVYYNCYHTNFRVGAGGEYLALVAPDGATIVHDYNSYECDVNDFGFPPQRRDYSYGIMNNDPDQEHYFGTPSPFGPNFDVLDGVVADTKFSVDRGFYEQPFSVEITTETEGANIRYTLDCSEPTLLTNGMDYTGPIDVSGSTSLRAAAFKTDYLPTNVDTHTYIFLDDVLTQSNNQSALGLPSEWINGLGTSTPGGSNTRMVREADYEIDPDVALAKSDLTTIPSISIVMNADDWFGEYTGIYTNSIQRASSDLQWEKEGSVELIYPNPNVGEEFQLNAGVRISGELARWPVVNKKQGIRLLFKGDYGPTKLRTSFFPDSDVDRYDTIVLRSHWGCSWLQEPYLTTYYPAYTATWLNNDSDDALYIRDQYALDCYRDVGHISSEGRYVHLYINSIYWGLYEVIERADASFNAEHRGGDKEDYDVFKGNLGYTNVNGELHSAGGSSNRDTWNALFSYFDADISGQNTYGITTPVSDADYIEVQKYLDVEAFADYMLTLWTIARYDFPRKNWYAAAKRGLPGQPPENKFVFYVWDSEASLWGDFSTMQRGVNVNMKGRYVDYKASNDTGPVRLFRRLMLNKDWKLLFADRMQKFLFNDGALTPGANIDRFMVRANEIDRAIVGESARWGDATITYADNPLTRDVEWVTERDWVLNEFFPYRTDIVIEQLRDLGLYPNVNAPVFAINGSNQHGGQVDNGAELSILVDITEPATIWYTLDGSDPRVSGVSVPVEPPSSVTLIYEDDAKRVLVPTVANGGNLLGTTWTGGGEPFDDSGWNDAAYVPDRAGGVGYERSSGYQNYISYDVEGVMYGLAETCYIRVPFSVSSGDLAGAGSLSLKARYDDAFVAYINGVEVTRSSLVPTPLVWNSGATNYTNPETTAFETFDIFDHIDDLQAGDNILAIHLLNAGTTSSDLLMSVELEVSTGVEVAIATLTSSTQVKASVLTDSGEWSALSEAVFAVGPVAESLRITEIMYHPQDAPAGNPYAEFVELKNIGLETINLCLVQFTNGIDYTFGAVELAAGEYVVVVKDQASFEAEYGYGINVAGQYTGSLANGGERIELEDAAGQTILNFRYRDGWCDITDGDGYSLTINDAAGDPNNWDEKKGWSASTFLGGSPGQPDNGPRYGDIVINEVLSHSNVPPGDWIELHNTTDSVIDISGWFLSDKASNLTRYQIPAATIPAQGYIVFTQDYHFGGEFGLSENGETVYLSSGLDMYGNLTGYRNQEDFGASESDVAFGRYRKSTETYNFVAMSENTPGPSYEGAANAYPKVDPIVINEIMYNAGPGRHNEEYIELYNISDSAVTLYNLVENEPWKFTCGIDFAFPASPGVTIDPGECLLVVKDPTAFSERFPTVPGEKILGPYDGLLANDGEKLEISMPGDESGGTRFYIRIDRVNYSDGWHPDNCPGDVDLWPTEPDGDGDSLNRIFAQYYGNDPNNWQAASPSPGVP